MSNKSDTLQINVAEEIVLKDIGPGTPAPTAKQTEEQLPPEEIEKRQKILTEFTRLSARYCLPHNKKSRWVTEADLPRVIADGKDLVAMCSLPRGKYSGIAALAHPQIDDRDPLRFFVLPNGMVVINPVITLKTKVPVFKKEGCMSHSTKEMKEMIPRPNKITVTYQTLAQKNNDSEPELSKSITETLNGGYGHIFVHEIDHLNGQDIYTENFDPEACMWLGDGVEMTQEELNKLYG